MKEQIGFRPPSFGRVEVPMPTELNANQALYPITMDEVKSALGIKKKAVNPFYVGIGLLTLFVGAFIVSHDLMGLFPMCIGTGILGYEVGRSE